jgi:hypothetical protein
MGAKRVINNVHVVPMGMANAFLIEGDDGLTLIDAGLPAKEAGRSARLAVRRTTSSASFSLTVTPIISVAPLRSCGKPVPGLTCTRSISRWPKAAVRFDL